MSIGVLESSSVGEPVTLRVLVRGHILGIQLGHPVLRLHHRVVRHQVHLHLVVVPVVVEFVRG